MTRFCIILGAAKAGTTSLFHYLAQHPEIAPCKNKESGFFSQYYDKGYNWYLSLWEHDSIQNKILLEATVNYTNRPSFTESPQNIFDFSQKHDISIRFIYIMRSPIERAESQYNYSNAHLVNWSIEKHLDKGHIINVSNYAKQLDPYFQLFDPKNFLLLSFEDLVKKPSEILKNICEFLEIDPTFNFTMTKKIYNPTEGTPIVRPINNMLKYPALKWISDHLPKGFKKLLSKILVRRIKKKVKLTNEQRQQIYNALKDDMERLHDKYGVDVKRWGF